MIPSSLDTPDFRELWDAYVEYRKESRMKPLKPISVALQMRRMAKWGLEASTEAIETTIANGWQGIFQPKPNGNSSKSTAQNPRAAQQIQRSSHPVNPAASGATIRGGKRPEAFGEFHPPHCGLE